MPSSADKNRTFWNQISAEYQRAHGPQLGLIEPTWGLWARPESELQILGEVDGLDVLELGCGGAQWSIALARRGARVVGLDLSAQQLEHARRLIAQQGVEVRLIEAGAESVPLPDRSFDLIFCDHGGMSFADPRRTLPEAARLLRPGGRLIWNATTPLLELVTHRATEAIGEGLLNDYFELGRVDMPDGSVSFQLPYGTWIALFIEHGFTIEALIELRPPEDAATTFHGFPLAWARRFPAEQIWKLRRAGR